MADMREQPWLLAAPADFRAALKSADAGGDVEALRRLATRDLDVGQLAKLSGVVARHRQGLSNMGTLAALRLGIVSSHTSDFIAEALPATALRHGMLLDCMTGDFGLVAQTVLDPASAMAGRVDAVLLALDPRMLGLHRALLAEGDGKAAVDRAVATLRQLCEGVRSNLGAFCVVTTLPPPAEALFGSADRRIAGTPLAMIEAYNARLAAEVMESGDLLVDVAQLAATIGLARWHDPRGWHSAKLPFALDYVPLYADHICRVLAAARGKARKCLVLDLDNTLWGGVIGDDGLEGIAIGQGSAAGEAHAALQHYALQLRERGVILAVCSKNDEANARAPFDSHPEMVLKGDHFAAFVANRADKASNLRAIAAMLNIGTDALVFLDDNPAEREIVRRELPEVAVPEIGADPADYVPLLAAGGWFEALSLSDEDRARADYYQANAGRAAAQTSLTNMGDYLASLEMVATLTPFDGVGRVRIAQLVNKSNQFNLTTRRYGEADIAAIEQAPDRFTVQVRLADRFGDNGMISVIVFDRGEEIWECDTWLMSCRVLGRRVEEAVLAHVAAAAKDAGARALRGTYLPTPKNGLVEKHFNMLGFRHIGDLPDGGTRWELDLARYAAPELPMTILTGALDRDRAA